LKLEQPLNLVQLNAHRITSGTPGGIPTRSPDRGITLVGLSAAHATTPLSDSSGLNGYESTVTNGPMVFQITNRTVGSSRKCMLALQHAINILWETNDISLTIEYDRIDKQGVSIVPTDS